ncbi:MAG: GNAT family N-acetyltransferase [Clostridia bacterium]|nr:GNAT family N-acetyltransferase [Clostridia bacterium]
MTVREERLSAEEYIDFLKHTDLGSQYPKERFHGRIEKLVKTASISLTAREGERLVGVLFGLTDFSYWLFVTDLGVDREFTHRGIGKALLQRAHEIAGGEKDVAVYLVANDKAIPFYEKCGFEKAGDVMTLNKIDWTPFRVE